MPMFTHGDILETTSQPLVQTFSLDDTEIGPCWAELPDAKHIPEIAREDESRLFYVPGRNGALIDALCRTVRHAKHLVCVSSFLIQETEFTQALLETANRGIPVFILTAREEDLKKPADEMLEDERSKIDAHIELLKKFAGVVLIRTCDNFHAKYCVVDPLSQTPHGILMTCNANLDPMTGTNIEIAVSLQEQEIKGLFSHFLHGFWDMANHELLGPNNFRGVRTEEFEEIDRGSITIPATWKDGHTLQDALLDLIESAKKSIFLTAWAFEEDGRVFPALRDAMTRGVSVTILTKPTGRTTSALLPLVEKGATVLGHDRFHAKIAIVDNQKAILMTANYTKKGLEEGFEAGILLDSKDTKTLYEITSLLETACTWKLSAYALIRDVGGKIKRSSKGSGELEVAMIDSEVSVELPTYQVDLFEKIPEDFITRERTETTVREKYPGKIIRNVSVKRKIVVPTVPNEAKSEDHKEVPFKVFRTKKNLYIAITKWEDLDRARKFAKEMKAKIAVHS